MGVVDEKELEEKINGASVDSHLRALCTARILSLVSRQSSRDERGAETMTNPAATETSKIYYTVTWFYPQGVELTSKEAFATREDAESYIGREIVGDDGTLDIRTFRINTVTV